MAKHTLQDSGQPQSIYVTDAAWTAEPAQFDHPNDSLHFGSRKVFSSFILTILETKPKNLKMRDAHGDFRITGDLAVTEKKVIFYITEIELIREK